MPERARTWVLLAAWSVLLGGCPVPQPRPPGKVLSAREAANGAKYYYYVPTYYSEDRDWPLVVTLHGTHGWDGPKRQVLEWGALAERRGFLVAAPTLQSVQGILPVPVDWWLRDLEEDERNVLAVIDELCRKYPRIDPEAVLLTGFSAGGYPLYYIGLRNAERFHMLIARDCNSSIKLFERIKLTDRARSLPIAIFWGKDDVGIREESWEALAWLRRHRCYGTRRKKVPGGHFRRPELAYQIWRAHLPPRHRR